ncbi:unnamed protein product [Linum tenue]|uniref:Uncharacterized protein n=1 Tax=Linum tenue TaxID=586396 RepID=A0AAV0M733_9ROSI|nr:unnamed protein product [Linum tenue]
MPSLTIRKMPKPEHARQIRLTASSFFASSASVVVVKKEPQKRHRNYSNQSLALSEYVIKGSELLEPVSAPLVKSTPSFRSVKVPAEIQSHSRPHPRLRRRTMTWFLARRSRNGGTSPGAPSISGSTRSTEQSRSPSRAGGWRRTRRLRPTTRGGGGGR